MSETVTLETASKALKRIVEEIDGSMRHGTWRDENGVRLKDTPEWVAFYNALSDLEQADPSQAFARWCEQAPKLAKAAGVYVGIKVTDKAPRANTDG